MLTALSNWVKAVRGGERRIDAGREWLVGLLAVVALAFTVVMWLQGKAGRTLAQGANKSAQQSNRLAVYQLCMNNVCVLAAHCVGMLYSPGPAITSS